LWTPVTEDIPYCRSSKDYLRTGRRSSDLDKRDSHKREDGRDRKQLSQRGTMEKKKGNIGVAGKTNTATFRGCSLQSRYKAKKCSIYAIKGECWGGKKKKRTVKIGVRSKLNGQERL